MKGALVIIDGMGDRPCRLLKGKTPLEDAIKPNMNYLAGFGELGLMYSVKKGVVPESDSAVLSILGNKISGSCRGKLEALGAGLKSKHGDLAFRTNFATINNIHDKKIIDRRAGRTLTTKEANILADAVNKQVKLSCEFIFKNTVQHRGVLILKGGFSDNITNTDSAYHSDGKVKLREVFKFSKPLDEDENSKYASNILNEFIEQSHKILDKHPVNLKRKKRGLLPANIILTRGGCINLPKLRRFRGWGGVVNMPLEIGICRASRMEVFSFPYPEMKSLDVYENLYAGLKRACKFARKIIKKHHKNLNYFYIHFKEPDVPGHDNKPNEKKYMLEFIDNHFFGFLRKFAEKRKIKVLVTADHATPCELKSHSADPVPVLLCNWGRKKEKEFSEKTCGKGRLGKINGVDLLKLF